MVDVNFVQYGVNALRTQKSAGDLLSFLAQNGYALGAIIGIILAFVLILFLVVFFFKKGHHITLDIFK